MLFLRGFNSTQIAKLIKRSNGTVSCVIHRLRKCKYSKSWNPNYIERK